MALLVCSPPAISRLQHSLHQLPSLVLRASAPTVECSQSRCQSGFCGSYHRDSVSHVNAVKYTFAWVVVVSATLCGTYAILVVRKRRPIIDCWISRCSRLLQTPTAEYFIRESGLRGHHADRKQASDASSLQRAAELKPIDTASRESSRAIYRERCAAAFAARMYGPVVLVSPGSATPTHSRRNLNLWRFTIETLDPRGAISLRSGVP